MSIHERKSNIELLRIIAMVGVLVLHFINPSIGGAQSYVQGNMTKEMLLYILKILFIPAVDTFLIISGYFMCRKESVSIAKIIQLIYCFPIRNIFG